MADTGPASPVPSAPGGADPSMDDILASIRRILNEDDVHSKSEPDQPDDTLLLDGSMLVAAGVAGVGAVPSGHENSPAGEIRGVVARSVELPVAAPVVNFGTAADTASAGLVAPDSAAAASSSVAMLVQALTSNRQSQTHRQGPTIEDVVRDEMRPILKAWLDLHLPPLVERLVRAEIERVVSRTTG